MLSFIDLGVQDFGHLKFRLVVYHDRWRRWLDSVGNGIQGCWFQHRDVEDRVYSTQAVRKSQSNRVGTGSCKDFVRPRNLSESFLEGRVVQKNCALRNAWVPILNSSARFRQESAGT